MMPQREEAAQAAVLLSFVRAHARAREAVSVTVRARVRAAWQRLANPYDDRQVRAFAESVAPVVAAGRTRTANLAESHLRLVLRELDSPAGRGHAVVAPDPRGVPILDEYERPAERFRYKVSTGKSPAEAAADAVRLAETLAETDLAMAARDASRIVLVGAPGVTGWRRIIHPELARGGSCGLCVAAATRIYHVEDLMPLHAQCGCTVLPIIGSRDPGLSINDVDLGALYRQVGGTAAAKLRKARFTVGEHGEIGPVLLEPGQHFRGPADVAVAAA